MATTDDASHADHDVEVTDPTRIDASIEETPKRKASFDAEDSAAKRARRDDEDIDGTAEAANNHQAKSDASGNADERRKSAVQEEKKRSKRLFGGLLSTLSQTTANPHQKRRQEIERRQQERLQQQKAEDEQQRADKFARLRGVRMTQQIIWDEEVMRNRHSKMLEQARYLQTKTKPQIYYMPWKLSDEQRDIIEDQIRDAKRIVEKELADFEDLRQRHHERYATRRRSSAVTEPPAKSVTPMDTAETGDPKDAAKTEVDLPAEAAAEKAPATRSEDHHHHHDESGDVMVEAGEDMVIY